MKIHPLTYLYLLLAFISGSSYYVAFLFFSILHEIGHYLVALYFSFEIEKIMILPFGAFLSLKDLGKHYVYEEIGMLLCGPFIYLICFIFLIQFEVNKEKISASYTAEDTVRKIETQLGRYLENSEMFKNIISSKHTISDEQFNQLASYMKKNKKCNKNAIEVHSDFIR